MFSFHYQSSNQMTDHLNYVMTCRTFIVRKGDVRHQLNAYLLRCFTKEIHVMHLPAMLIVITPQQTVFCAENRQQPTLFYIDWVLVRSVGCPHNRLKILLLNIFKTLLSRSQSEETILMFQMSFLAEESIASANFNGYSTLNNSQFDHHGF